MYVIYQNEKKPEIICVTDIRSVAEYFRDSFEGVNFKEAPNIINNLQEDLNIIHRLKAKEKS